jgi:hypothetical protein
MKSHQPSAVSRQPSRGASLTRGSWVALGLLVLGACTGSKEDNPNLKLVLPVRGSSAFSVFCAGQSRSFTAPGVLFASTDALANTSSGIDPVEACQLVTTASAPYDTLNTATGSAAWVSFPGEGTVRRYKPDRTIDPAFNLQTVPDLCPTRLSLSPDESKLVVLDDPSDPNGCNAALGTRGSRIAVFNATTGALLTDGLLTVATPGDRTSGQVAASLDNTSLIVLEPFAGFYRLERYFFADLKATPLRTQPLSGVSASNVTPVDVSRIGSGFAVSIGGFNSKALTVNLKESGTTGADIVAFGADITAVEKVDAPLRVTATDNGGTDSVNRIVNVRNGDDSLTAYLRANSILFKRDAQPTDLKRVDAGRISSIATDLTFTPDGFAWALVGVGTSLQKIDTFNFPLVNVTSSAGLGGATALSITWVIL